MEIEKTTKLKNMLIYNEYDYVGDFSEGLAWFRSDGYDYKYGFIDKDGNEVVEAKYDWVVDFYGGLACFKLNGKYGFIDKYGNEVIEAKYDGVGNFEERLEGLACFESNGKDGFIDKYGNEVVKAKYDGVRAFQEGLAIVQLNCKYGLINKDGEEITDICFDDISISDEMVIFNRSYAIPIKDLQFSYGCKIRMGEEEDVFEFDSKDKRDEFYKNIKVKGIKLSINMSPGCYKYVVAEKEKKGNIKRKEMN